MNIPVNFLWGVDVAIKKLRPGASFGLSNKTFTSWSDPSGKEPPSWEEIDEQIEKDKAEAEKWMKSQQ